MHAEQAIRDQLRSEYFATHARRFIPQNGIGGGDYSSPARNDTFNLPNYTHLLELAEELGDDFESLAPKLYAEYQENLNIVNYRKAKYLLGV